MAGGAGVPYVDQLGYVEHANLDLDALFVVAHEHTNRPRLVGAEEATRVARLRHPALMFGWLVGRRVYQAGDRMPERTMLLLEVNRQNRNTLVPIRAIDRDKYDAQRYLQLDSDTTKPDQSGGQFLLSGLQFDVTTRLHNGRR